MADLPELNEWTAGVYQLETSDPVLGGPEGIDNLQAKQLANRTLWLKGKLDALFDGTTAAGKTTKLATPRAISISGAATGTVNFDGGSNVDISLTLADLSWLKITSGKPTTLGGYGITDAYTKAVTYTRAEIDALLAESVVVATPKHYMAGFGMALNAASPNTAIDVAPGNARVTGNPVTLSTSMSGVLQSAGVWGAGSGANKLDAGLRAANTWYHVFIIRKLVGGDADLLFSTNVGAPIVPAGFEMIQRIGSIKTDTAANIIPFINVGRSFFWSAPIKDASGSTSVNGNAALNVTISVPAGVRVLAKIHAAFTGSATNLYFRAPDAASISSAWLVANTAAAVLSWNGGLGMNTSDVDYGSFPFETLTNLASAVVMQWQNSATAGFYAIVTLGWTEL